MKIKKVIYFPTGFEPGMDKGYPCIFYAGAIIKDIRSVYYRGSKNKENAKSGHGPWILVNKCLDYSDEAWELCLDYMDRRSAITQEWNKLRMNIKKKVKDEH